MLEEIKSNDYADLVDVETNRYYSTIEEMADHARSLGCDGLVNCTGLGSKRLCNDDTLVGARGVLLHYSRASCKWRNDNNNQHVIPGEGKRRHDGVATQDSVILIDEPPFGTDRRRRHLRRKRRWLLRGGLALPPRRLDLLPGHRRHEAANVLRAARRHRHGRASRH